MSTHGFSELLEESDDVLREDRTVCQRERNNKSVQGKACCSRKPIDRRDLVKEEERSQLR